jgi:long-subunit acyl-CoA synthetase (AMP-forming)
MRLVEQRLADLATDERPFVEVLDDRGGSETFSYATVIAAASHVAGLLDSWQNERDWFRVGVIMANTPEWVVTDLALLLRRATEVPVPLTFSADQAAQLLSVVDLCLVDRQGSEQLARWGADAVLPAGCPVRVVYEDLIQAERPPATHLGRSRATSGTAVGTGDPGGRGDSEDEGDSEDWICKVIHTSGTTSQPKGVMIRADGLNELLASLRGAISTGAFKRCTSLVPFSLLIEQVTALYLVLLDGGSVVLAPSATPLLGSAPEASDRLLPFIRAGQPTALVATPALLSRVLERAEAVPASQSVAQELFGTKDPPLVFCGGAPVSPDVLHELDRLGISVCEGYGLSEHSSVVCLNTPTARRVGTVGRPLDHVEVRLGADDELLVRGPSLFAGYVGSDPSACAVDAAGWLHTGDLASIDEDGYIRITGRKKDVIITGNGRNVAPEWVESTYRQLSCVRAVAVVGDGLSELHGLFVIADGTSNVVAADMIARFGRNHLSGVERVGVVHLMAAGDSRYLRYFTVTGRPRRQQLTDDIVAEQLERFENEREDPRPNGVIITDLHDRGGLLLRAGSVRQLALLERSWILALLSRAGYLLFRDFDVDIESFSSFVSAYSDVVTLDPARTFHGGLVAQKVDAGMGELGLHCENGNSPFSPDLAWFFCPRAAATGSSTIVCDGHRVWRALSPSAQDAFLEQDVLYTRHVSEAAWKLFVAHHRAAAPSAPDVAPDDLLALVNDPDSTTIDFHEDGSITYRFHTPAAHPTLLGPDLAFANSLLGPSYNYEAPTITFVDGSPLPRDLWCEIKVVTEAHTEELVWQDGDVALIDNTRVMHGRRKITDPARTIFTAQSYVDRSLL